MKDRILLSASLFHSLNDAASVIVPMTFPILYGQSHLITSYSQIGLLSNLGLMTTLCVQFLIVKLSYHVEYRSLMLMSLVGICSFMAVITMSSSFVSLLLFFLLLRISMSFYHPIVIAWVSKSQPLNRLDLAMGIQSGSGNAGVFLAFVSVGYLAERWGWKTPLLSWSLFGMLLGTLGLVVLRHISTKGENRPPLRVSSWLKVLSKVGHLIPGFVFGGVGWAITVFYAPSLLNHEFGIPMGRTGLFMGLWIGLGTLSGYGYGFLSRWFGRKPVFLLSIGGSSLCLCLLGLAPARTAAVAGLLLFGMFLLIVYPSLHTFIGSTVPVGEQTQAFSWLANIQMISGALIALLAGFFSDRFGIRSAFILSAALSATVLGYYMLTGTVDGKARSEG